MKPTARQYATIAIFGLLISRSSQTHWSATRVARQALPTSIYAAGHPRLICKSVYNSTKQSRRAEYRRSTALPWGACPDGEGSGLASISGVRGRLCELAHNSTKNAV